MRDLKASRRRWLRNKARSWLKRPVTFKAATVVLNVIYWAAKLLDLFK